MLHSRHRPYHSLLIALLLLLIAASRAFRLDATVTEVTVDEVWSVWQSQGTPEQIIRWTPYDWTPGYYLTLGGWRALVGIHPAALRWLSLLAFVLGAAALYRTARKLGGDGLIASAAYAGFGFLIFLSTELRGYSLLLALYPLAIWLALRYFDKPRLSTSVVLALCMAAMVLASMTSIPALAGLALFTLFVYRRAVWRWWLPSGLAVLIALPALIRKVAVAVARTRATSSIILKPVPEALAEIYGLWSGNAFWLWLFLLAAAALLSLRFRRRGKRRAVAVGLVVWALLPLALYVTNPVVGFFNVRYAWWVMAGLALLLGVGLAALPMVWRAVVTAVFGVLMLLPIPLDRYQIPQPPLGTAFAWLTEHALPGDVVLVDPNCGCGAPEVFDYYSRVYFPAGLTFVQQADGTRRIWYVTGAAGASAEVYDAVSAGRNASIFVGPPEGLFRLYEAPPDSVGIAFASGMRFQGAERIDRVGVPVYHEGEALNVQLWWSVDAPPALDYRVGLYVVNDAGEVVMRDERAPNVSDAPNATSQWQPGRLYVEQRTLQLRYPLPKGEYRLMMAVYRSEDQAWVRKGAEGRYGLLPLFDFNVVSWKH